MFGRQSAVCLDDTVVSSSLVAVLLGDLGVTDPNGIGGSQFTAAGFFTGAVDAFRIYVRVPSASEIRYLAGDR